MRESLVLSIFGLLAGGSAMAQTSPRTYLPAVGPAPLRFAMPEVEPAAKRPLPPLVIPPLKEKLEVVMEEFEAPLELEETSQEEEDPGAAFIDSLMPPLAPVPTDPAAPSTNSTNNNGSVLDPITGQQPQVIAPQMLLRFFNRNPANNSGAGVVAPFGFTPPSTTPASSSATYTTQ